MTSAERQYRERHADSIRRREELIQLIKNDELKIKFIKKSKTINCDGDRIDIEETILDPALDDVSFTLKMAGIIRDNKISMKIEKILGHEFFYSKAMRVLATRKDRKTADYPRCPKCGEYTFDCECS